MLIQQQTYRYQNRFNWNGKYGHHHQYLINKHVRIVHLLYCTYLQRYNRGSKSLARASETRVCDFRRAPVTSKIFSNVVSEPRAKRSQLWSHFTAIWIRFGHKRVNYFLQPDESKRSDSGRNFLVFILYNSPEFLF